MENFMNMPIKEIIKEHLSVGGLLEQYNIGCVPCSVGTCLLKDILKIHNLSKKDEAQLMYKIEKELYPERDVKLKEVNEEEYIPAANIKYSPPIQQLVDEHIYIKRVLAHIPNIIKLIQENKTIDKNMILNLLRFIREYADKFHHAKEEDILFDYADKSQEIINIMLQDHDTGRGFVKAVVAALEADNKEALIDNLIAYKELLTQHILKEDDILYPWIDRELTTKQIGEMFQKFAEANTKIGEDLSKRNLEFLFSLDTFFNNK